MWKKHVFSSGFSHFPDQPDPEIRKFLQIPNGLAKTVNLIYYLQKVIFGAPDGPDPPDGAGAGVGGQVEVMLPWRDDPRTPTDEAHPLDPAYEAAF